MNISKIYQCISLSFFVSILSVFYYQNLYAMEPYDEDLRSVFERIDYSNKEDLGLRGGTFQIRPSLYFSEIYNDNIFATDDAFVNDEDDFITVIQPMIDVRSDWNRHRLDFGAMGDFGIYLDNSRENYHDAKFYGLGRLDIKQGTSLGLKVNYGELHEARTSPDNSAGIEPTKYDDLNTIFSYDYNLRRTSLLLQGQRRTINFENGKNSDGAIIENNHRDRTEDQVKFKLAYEYIPNYTGFVIGTYDDVRFDRIAMLDRDSEGYTVAVGTDINITGKEKADVYVKYISRDYKSAGLKDVDDFSFGGNLLWEITGLTSLKLGLERRIEETNVEGASSSIITDGKVRVEHEIKRDLLLGASVEWLNYDFQFTDNTRGREDDVLKYEAEAKYLINRRFSAGLKYNHNRRDSNVEGLDYEANIVVLDFKLDI